MADIRFKDLTTTASSTASDDFIAVDGTTNGTRKLSAFSPTFGGNATVTGTLTVNGALSSTSSVNGYEWSVAGSGIGGPYLTLDATNATTANRFTGLLLKNNGTLQWTAQLRTGDGNFHIYDAVRSVSTLTIAPGALSGVAGTSTFAGAVAITSTTASTTTSTGALVVSGGVGVAGAGNFGGAVGVGGATVASRLHVYESTSGTGDSNGITIEQASTADAALQFLLTGVQRWTVGIDNSDSDKFKIGTGAIGSADRLTIDTSGNLSIPATTASTSISSGALVVSGGVGITGNAYVGGRLMVVGGIDNTIAGNVEFSTGQIRVTNAYTATSATAAGAVGSITWDNLYIYVCVATNTWKRVAISSW